MIFWITITIFLTISTDFNVAITTRGSRYPWRDSRQESSQYYHAGDQYRDYSHSSYLNRRPPPLSVEDIYREAERYNNYNSNPRFHRQNQWQFRDKYQENRNTEAFFPEQQDNFQNQNRANNNRNKAENFQDSSSNRDTRQTYTPAPYLPWEDALRHSVYLTLIRDKIDNILTNPNRRPSEQNLEKNSDGKDVYESTDVDLWRNIKKAPFKTNGKEKGPVFGDIAILSRGKLVQGSEGFQFIEDEEFKECIECHLYSSRPNEDEAEKILMEKCNHPSCRDQITRALWTVRRIRHRNTDGKEPKFMYELMFSIASPKPGKVVLDYNAPSQTFTINENDEELKKYIDDRSKKVVFVDEKSRDSYKRQNIFDGLNINKQFDNSLNTGEYKTQNIGDFQNTYKNKPMAVSDPRIMNDDYEDEDHVTNTNKYQQKSNHNTESSVITHLHHHYYLNDKGIPMRKPSVKYDKINPHEIYLPSMYDIDTITEMDPRILIPDTEEKIDTTGSAHDPTESYEGNLHTTNNPVTRNIYTKPLTTSFYPKSKKKTQRPSKQFIPSPKDERITYSELDPLYISSTSVPNKISGTVVSDVDYPFAEDSVTENYSENLFTGKNTVTETSTHASTLKYEDSITNPNIGTTIENIYVSEGSVQFNEPEIDEEQHSSTTQTESVHIVYPVTKEIETITESPKKTTTANKRIERKPYKVTRRIKQKTFSELLKTPTIGTSTQLRNKPINTVNAQNDSVIELQKKIDDVSKKFAYNKTNSSNDSQRTVSRRKYQRKYSSWSTRRPIQISQSTTTSTTTPSTTTIEETDVNTSTEEVDTEIPFQDNVEEESEKEISIDRISTISDYDTQDDTIDTNHTKDYDNTEQTEISTQNTTTENTESSEEDSDVISTSDINNVIKEATTTTEVTKLSSESENDESVYTPLTKKSYVTSISLKLGNETRPYYQSLNNISKKVTNIENEAQTTTERITTTEKIEKRTIILFNILKDNDTSSTTTENPKSDEHSKNNTNVELNEDVEVAKIVQHTSLHKLKIEDK